MSVETNPHNYTNMKNTFSQFLNPAPNFPKTKRGASGGFLPQTPPPPLATSEFKKDLPSVLRNPFPKKLFSQNRVRISPATCPNTWRAEHQRKMSFPF